MYKGKIKRLRKKDLHKVDTLAVSGSSLDLKEIGWEIAVAPKGLFGRHKLMKYTTGFDKCLHDGDVLSLSIPVKFVLKDGSKCSADGDYVLLPAGPTYYTVDEPDDLTSG